MKSGYHPKRKTNPIVLDKKIEKLSAKLENLQNTLSAVNQANATHIGHLANFARHDMGNAIQNLHATIKNIEDEVSGEIIEELKASLSMLESTLHNLGQMTHFANKDNFHIPNLFKASEILSRSIIQKNGISLRILSDSDFNTVTIVQPFQGLLQMIHNMILNAVKSFQTNQAEKIIEITVNREDNLCVIEIKNNGRRIPEEDRSKIFDFGFTTTSGSGIGLAYAKYLCEEMNGSIEVSCDSVEFSTVFTIKFPISQ